MEKHHVLIVDDVPDNLKLLEKILSKLDLYIHKAESGLDAIKLAKKYEFSLILVDVMMLDIDGLETVEKIKQTPLNKDLLVVFLSAIQKNQRNIIRGYELGAFDYITKPFDYELLLNKVKLFCDLFEQKKILKTNRIDLRKKNTSLSSVIEENNRIQKKLNENQKELNNYKNRLEELVNERTWELHKARDQAEKATQAKSEFLANISHELRTPVHQILGFAKLGIDKIHDENKDKLLEYFKEVYSAAQRMSILQNNLLDMSKLETGEAIFDFQDENVSDLIYEVLEDFTKQADERDIAIEIQQIDIRKNVSLDKNKIALVMRHLVNNALCCTGQGGKISIKVKSEQQNINVSVIDSGIGIPEDELISIFDCFSQGSNTRKEPSGSGLGLFISSMIITGHGGRIWATNNPDKGLNMTFSLPIKQVKKKRRIGQILVEKGYLTKDELLKELKNQEKES